MSTPPTPGAAGPVSRSAVVISHGPDCLDGMAAAVSLARAYGPARVSVHFTQPSDLDRLLEDLPATAAAPGDLWITDISWKREATERRLRALGAGGWRIFWIDHHVNALARLARGLGDLGLAGHRVTADYSAARLTYEFLLETRPFPGPVEPLVEFEPVVMLADDADRWLHRLPRSRELALVVAELGDEAYGEFLTLDPRAGWTPAMERALARSRQRLAASIETALATRVRVKTADGVTVVGCICTGFASEVADRLREDDDNGVIVMYNTDTRRMSLRRLDRSAVDCARIAMALGGGGHPAAAGFDLPELDAIIVTKIIDTVTTTLRSFTPSTDTQPT